MLVLLFKYFFNISRLILNFTKKIFKDFDEFLKDVCDIRYGNFEREPNPENDCMDFIDIG